MFCQTEQNQVKFLGDENIIPREKKSGFGVSENSYDICIYLTHVIPNVPPSKTLKDNLFTHTENVDEISPCLVIFNIF